MTVKQLLKPRYKVIADYPGMLCKIGDVITPDTNGHQYWIWNGNNCVNNCVYVGSYPHLFRKLHWWEERKPEEMPMYLKDIGDGEVFMVKEYIDNKEVIIWQNKKKNHVGYHQAGTEHFTPATETEYNEYLKTLNP